jgi:hypothetical protein
MARTVKTPTHVPDAEKMLGGVSDSDKKFINHVMELRDAAEGAKSHVERTWEHYYNMWATNQWEDIYVDEWRSKPQVNYTFSTVELDVATITDQNPETIVYPKDDQNEEAQTSSEILNKIFQDTWRKGYGQNALKQWVRGSRIYGTAFMKVGFNTENSMLTFNYLPPDQVHPDPNATTIDSAWYVIHRYTMSINDVRKYWPSKANHVTGKTKEDAKADSSFDRSHYQIEDEDRDTVEERFSYTDGKSRTDAPRDGNWNTGYETVDITELWQKGIEGKIRVSYIANDSVLLDTVEEPLGSKVNVFPFIRMVCTPVDNEMWGMSLIQPLEPLQVSVNKRTQQIIDHMRYTTSPILIAEDGTIDDDVVIDTPGTILTVDRPEAVKWMDVPQLGAGPFQMKQMDRSDFETISGAFDVVQGRTPSGIEAAAAIMSLQEAAQVRQRDRMSEMERSLEKMARLCLLLIQSNYSEERALNLMGYDGKAVIATINREIKVEELTEEDIAALQEAKIAIDSIDRALDITRGDFDIQLVAGSTVKPPEAAVLNKMLTLYDRGIIPQDSYGAELVLRALNFPNVDEISEYLQAKEEAQAQQMAAMQAQMGGGGPEGQVGPGGFR